MDTRWWLGMMCDLGLLAVESAEVMVRRSVRIARGNSRARAEFDLMVTEKIRAVAELQHELLRGEFGTTPAKATRGLLNAVRRKVRANRRRLRK